MSDRPLVVLSVAHAAAETAVGRLRYRPLASRADIETHLLAPRRWRQFGRTIDADPPDSDGIRMHILPARFLHSGPMNWYLHIYPGMKGLIRQVSPQVIHLWEEPWALVALQAAWLKRDRALVLEVDQNILKRLPPPFEGIRRYVLRRTDHILSRSPDATEVVRACGYRGPVSEIGYGVDTETFHPKCARPSSGLRLGYVGRLVVEKGLDDVLDAMAQSSEDIVLAIMGEGPYETSLRAKVDTLGLSERVTFSGWGTPQEVADHIRGLDVALLVTRTTRTVKEQFGRAIIEAQSCGVPVIGSASGAIPSVVADGGWIVPEHDPAALLVLFEKLRSDKNLIDDASIAAKRNVRRRFTYQAVAGQLAEAWIAAAKARKLIG